MPTGDGRDDELQSLVRAFLERSQVGYERFFFDWWGGPASVGRAAQSPAAPAYASPEFAPLRRALEAYEPVDAARLDGAYFSHDTPETLLIDEIEQLWDAIAERDDWGPFEAKVESIRAMGSALDIKSGFPRRPE